MYELMNLQNTLKTRERRKIIDILQNYIKEYRILLRPSLGKVGAAKSNGTTLVIQSVSHPVFSVQKGEYTKRLASVQHLGPVGQDLSYAWPGIVSRAFFDRREYTEARRQRHTVQSNFTNDVGGIDTQASQDRVNRAVQGSGQ